MHAKEGKANYHLNSYDLRTVTEQKLLDKLYRNCLSLTKHGSNSPRLNYRCPGRLRRSWLEKGVDFRGYNIVIGTFWYCDGECITVATLQLDDYLIVH